MATQSVENWLNNPIVKIIGTVFLFGVAAARFEYKQDENFERIIKKIDEHIITDGFEKQIQNNRMAQLEKKIDDLEYYLKPEGPEIKTKRR